MTRQVNPLSFAACNSERTDLRSLAFELKYTPAKRQCFNQRDQFGGPFMLCNAHCSSRMPDPQTELQAHKNDSVRVKANNHDKGRIATNKAEPRIGGASIVDSLPCSSLFVLLLQPKAALSGS